MSVFIYQPDAFARVAQVEGEEWVRAQEQGGPHSWSALYRTWSNLQALLQDEGEDLVGLDKTDVLVLATAPGDGAIVLYGWGGWRRYRLKITGELVCLADTTTVDGCRKAEAAGFRVVPG